jgi:hypothetical protein
VREGVVGEDDVRLEFAQCFGESFLRRHRFDDYPHAGVAECANYDFDVAFVRLDHHDANFLLGLFDHFLIVCW